MQLLKKKKVEGLDCQWLVDKYNRRHPLPLVYRSRVIVQPLPRAQDDGNDEDDVEEEDEEDGMDDMYADDDVDGEEDVDDEDDVDGEDEVPAIVVET